MNEVHKITPALEPFKVELEDLSYLDDNPRRGNVEAIAKSLDTFGQLVPLVFKKERNRRTIYAGNHRHRAAALLGWTHIAAIDASKLTKKQMRAFALADNRTGDLAGYEEQELLDQLRDLSEPDLEAIGYAQEDVNDLLAALEPELDDESKDLTPEPPSEPITKLGDVWEVGRHRLVCGDATVQGVPDDAAVMLTDPPYGISYASNKSGKLKGEGVRSDHNTESGRAVLELWGTARPSAVFWTHKRPFPADVSKSTGALVWHKGGGGMGDLSFPWFLDWEMAYIFGKGWRVPAKQMRGTSVLSGHRMTNRSDGVEHEVDQFRSHPTQKPVSLLKEILLRAPAGDVWEPFAGSGSTLIACEQVDRICHAVELDPKYCDVIVERFHRFTGQPVKLNGKLKKL